MHRGRGLVISLSPCYSAHPTQIMKAGFVLFLSQPYFQIPSLPTSTKTRTIGMEKMAASPCILDSACSVLQQALHISRNSVGFGTPGNSGQPYAQWCAHDQDRPIRHRWQNLPARRK